MRVHHVNLQTLVGGGEIYTRSLTRALLDQGHEVVLYAHPENRFWDTLDERIEIIPTPDERALPELSGETYFVHTKISEDKASRIAANNRLVGFAHLPMYQREPEWLRRCTLVVTVSRYCLDLLRKAGVERLYPEPLYGVADIARGDPNASLFRTSSYLWDRRKMRDRILSHVYLFQKRKFDKRAGLTLGIVSLITPIKQFPLLFRHISPVLARHDVNLEIFGAGGYAQVRDLREQIQPIKNKTRWWGYQENVAAAYRNIDYLLAGLPEKEALGLNVLEAQMCGTPVLAPKAPPFTETVLDGVTGHLYRDPREDGAADFEKLLSSLGFEMQFSSGKAREHLDRFNSRAFAERVQQLLAALP